MPGDRFDMLHWTGLAVVAAALVALLLTAGPGGGAGASAAVDKALQLEIAYQARSAFLEKLYAPVEALWRDGDAQRALLKLEELARLYPGEAHGYVLAGGILAELEAHEESIAKYVRAVRLNGDYVDERSPFSRRDEIGRAVESGLERLVPRARANPDNPTLTAALKDVYYLQSRLAGGCE